MKEYVPEGMADDLRCIKHSVNEIHMATTEAEKAELANFRKAMTT